MSENDSEIIADLVASHKQDGRAVYSKGAKRRLVEACLRPSVSVAGMALANRVNANLLRKWITQYQIQSSIAPIAETSMTSDAVTLVPVALLPEAHKPTKAIDDQDHAVAQSSIEIVFGDTIVRLQGDVDAQRLRTVLDCLAVRPGRHRSPS